MMIALATEMAKKYGNVVRYEALNESLGKMCFERKDG